MTHEDAAMSARELETARFMLGIPYGWKLRLFQRTGKWVLQATAQGDRSLPCGHRSMQATATSVPLVVAAMARTVRFHENES